MTGKETEFEGEKGGRKTGKDPEWATGLKRLYNSVVDEPLPDDLAKLLSQLDADGGKK